MGLGIDVGQYAYCLQHDREGAEWLRQDVIAINAALQDAGLPEHVEPETQAPPGLPCTSSFPYSFLHYLRRAFAHTRPDRPPLTPAPPPDEWDIQNDMLLDEEATLFIDSHLCCHSDTEGYYVPIDFEEIVYADDVPGCMIGSSQALLRELILVAPLLSIELTDSTISEATARRLADTQESDPYFREKIVWGALFSRAQVSVQHGALLSFC